MTLLFLFPTDTHYETHDTLGIGLEHLLFGFAFSSRLGFGTTHDVFLLLTRFGDYGGWRKGRLLVGSSEFLCADICIVSNMAFCYGIMAVWQCARNSFGGMVPVVYERYVRWQADAVAGQLLWLYVGERME
jgi:hypothetical protein